MTFGEQLRQWRIAARINQRDLAKKVNIDFTYLSKIENGRMPPPSESVIQALVKALDKEDESDVLFRLAEKVPEDVRPIITASREAPALLRAISGLNDDAVRRLTKIAEEMKQKSVTAGEQETHEPE